MQFLALFKISIVLSDTLQSQLVHQVDENRVRYVAFLESLDFLREGSRIKHKLLACARHLSNDICNDVLKVRGEQLIALI